METLLHAYRSYEERVARGEFTAAPVQAGRRSFPLGTVLEASLGDMMIALGRRLKKHALAGKSMNWSPLTGSKA